MSALGEEREERLEVTIFFNHCIKPKHHKCFFKNLNPEDSRIAGLSNADIVIKAAEYEDEYGGSEERDYKVIALVDDYEQYIEMYW